MECSLLKHLKAIQLTAKPSAVPAATQPLANLYTSAHNVPKIIHQTWKTEQVPSHWQASQDEWIRLHPDWTYCLWTDEDIESYVRLTRPQAWQLFESMTYAIQRVDLFRYFIMHDFGGLYSDLDIVPLKCVEPFLVPGNIFLVESANSSGVYTNALLVSSVTAESKRFWSAVIQHVSGRMHDCFSTHAHHDEHWTTWAHKSSSSV